MQRVKSLISSKETESIYRKQSLFDNTFTTKARLLQSIWRVENGLRIGIGPNAGSVNKNTGLNLHNFKSYVVPQLYSLSDA